MLYSRDWHNIVNQLYFNQKKSKNKDVVYVYNGILFSHERNEILPFVAIWMDLKT